MLNRSLFDGRYCAKMYRCLWGGRVYIGTDRIDLHIFCIDLRVIMRMVIGCNGREKRLLSQ